MFRTLTVMIGMSWAVAGSAHAEGPADPLRVRAEVRPRTCYVGQPVDVFVSVAAGRERPGVTMPKVPGAGVSFVGTDLTPIRVSGVGDTVDERNLFRFRYLLLPRRAGTLTLPSIAARLGARRGASGPLTLTVRRLPPAGRPAEFLGGVGPFEVEARAEPTSVRAGAPIEFRVTVRGPGALGIQSPPGVARLERLPLGPRMERMPDRRVVDPPSHTFVYRLRPSRAGEAVLPPVAVAGFDPKSERYVTRVTPGVPVRVTAVPKFDPGTLAYGPTDRSTVARPWWPERRSRISVLIASALVSSLVVIAVWFRRRSRWERAVGRIITRANANLGLARDDAGRGRAVTESLIDYLALTTGRPRGALTPAEAAAGVARATGSGPLARRARSLVNECDRARFDERIPRTSPPASLLKREGSLFFGDLAKTPVLETARPGAGGNGAGPETR